GLMNHRQVEEANRRAFQAYLDASPVLEDVRPASEAIPALNDRLILHAGPPVGWEAMCGPMQGAVVGAILLEGWAASAEAARALAASGEIAFAPCHHHAAVGPRAGVLSPSMRVWSVAAGRPRTFASLNEGLGKVLRFGAHGADVLDRLRWMGATLGPALGHVLAALGGI